MATRRSARTRKREPPPDDVKDEGSKVVNDEVSNVVKDEGSKVIWEWEGDKGKWTSYDQPHAVEITKALTGGEDTVTVQVAPTVKLNIALSSMTQTNVATGWQRNVRCHSSGCGQWEWQNEQGVWNIYSPGLQRLFVACAECGVSEREIECGGRSYKLDLVAKKQINVETKVERKIRVTGVIEESSASKKKSDTKTEEAAAKPTPKASKASSSKSSASKPSSAKSSGKASSSKEKNDDSNGRVVVVTKGSVPVDYACTMKVGKASVYSEGREHWDAMLNQTNLKNNNNKFYIMQLLQDSGSRAQYSVWFRWGRVGKTGQNSLLPCGVDLEQAKNLFNRKFLDKTNNSWEDRDNFVKVAGKYDLLKIDYEAKDEADGEEEVDREGDTSEDLKPVESKLDLKVQSLVQLICNVKAMEDIVVEMKYDAEKAPLGKLTTNQIRLGYAALKKIEACINKSDFGDRLYKACDEFYTRIPHCFGMQRPPVIKTKEMVKEKIALLEALGDIQIAMKVLSSGDATKEHPVDRHYSELKCQLAPVDTEDSVFALVEKYMRQTHASTHNQYHLELLDLFSVEREGETEQFTDKGNRKLLWHGSRITNWVGILSQGLRIAPPEAPVTGYMFGKGLYFADMSSKSANYCFASKAKNEGLVLLCDVSLGNTHELLAAEYNADELVRGKSHSVLGLGRIAPNPSMDHTLSDGCVVPLGTSVDTGVSNPRGYTLNYNEYIVYDVKQVKMRYLAKVKFNFK